jgi:hypothetical protein
MFLLQTYNGNLQGSSIFKRAFDPVKMFFNHITAWLKPHRIKPSTVKMFKTRLMVNG